MKEQENPPLSHHFLHPHPLQHTNTPPKPNTTCSGCKLTLIEGNHYHKCQTCPFSLHQICYNMPQIAHHRSDPTHIFTLQPTPSSPLHCNACTNKINSFYYNCPKCCDYYHILCLAAPLSVRAPSHPHILNLKFSLPYKFQCDICHKPSHQGWLYRCGMCEFDVHFACAIGTIGAKSLQQQEVPIPIDYANKWHELMELLTRGVNRVGERMDLKITKPVQEGSNAGLEDRSLLSYQLSDACFSIDFAKSLLGNEMDDGKGVKEEGKDLSFSSDNRGSNVGVNMNNNVGFENGIGSHIWKQLDPESEKRYVNGEFNRKKPDNTSSDTGRMGCSCWSKVLMRRASFLYLRD